jgi:large subunit ribosomal protein L19e
MNLRMKRELASKTLGVGKNKIIFNPSALSEIKEAITKEDIRTLHKEGIITIKPNIGRRKVERRKTRKHSGKIKKKINRRKENYVKVTRKLRSYVKDLKNRGLINKEMYKDLRKKIKMKYFKSKEYLKEYVKKAESNVEVGKTSIKVKGRTSTKKFIKGKGAKK